MMGRRAFGRGAFGLLAGGATMLLTGCGLLGGNSYRFRMTVEIDTPEGIRTGSSVYEVKAANKVAITPEMADRDWSLHGEAVAVDLPRNKTLFALLKTESSDLARASMAALDPAFNNDVVESVGRIASNNGVRSPSKIPVKHYPVLVTFTDIADPKSVERVEPDDLTASFGPGYRLKAITLEVTRDDVTTGIEKRLGWLGEVGRLRSSLRTDVPKLLKDAQPIHLVTVKDFSSELYK